MSQGQRSGTMSRGTPVKIHRVSPPRRALHDGEVMSDEQLLERFVGQRDPAAFEELVRRHGPMVMRVCQRVLHHAHDAEDAFQATFIVLARKAQVIARGATASWLYGVAYRMALQTRDHASKHRTADAPVADRAADDPAREPGTPAEARAAL